MSEEKEIPIPNGLVKALFTLLMAAGVILYLTWTVVMIIKAQEYFDLGLRVGQQLGPMAFEEGLAATLFESAFWFGPGVGLTLVRPAVSLRGSWMPASVAGLAGNRLGFSFRTSRWWQVSAAAGTPYRPNGIGWSAGVRATKQGIGPLLTGELGSGVLSLRAEASVTWLAPWTTALDEGTYFSLGIGAAHHGHYRR